MQIAQQRRNLLQDRMNYLRDYRRQASDLRYDTTNQLRAMDLQQPVVNRGILNNYAGRGMAYSSGYAQTLGDATNQFATERTNLQSTLQTNLARMQADRQQAMNNYQYQLGNLNERHAQLTEPMAGNLGYDRKPPKKKPKKKVARRK